jgi:hypothetical protein
MSTILRKTSFFVAAALLVACGRDAVERKLVGTWQTAVPAPTGAYEMHFTAQSNGLYRTDVLGASVTPEFGLLKATSGRWRLERPTGSVDEGTYQFVSDDTVLFKSKAGVVLWTRLSKDGTAAVAATQGAPSPLSLPAPTGLAPAATPSSSSAESGGPSTALLAAGPFGPPIAEQGSAFSASGGGAGGAPNAAGFAAPAGFAVPAGSSTAAGFAAPLGTSTGPNATSFSTQAPPNQPGGTAEPLPTMTAKQAVAHAKTTVQQTASQTAATARAGAKQIESTAATSATDAVDGAAAETNKKVGQKIGAFAGNVGSKIKNFFTGGKRQEADTGSADGSAQQSPH